MRQPVTTQPMLNSIATSAILSVVEQSKTKVRVANTPVDVAVILSEMAYIAVELAPSLDMRTMLGLLGGGTAWHRLCHRRELGLFLFTSAISTCRRLAETL